MTLEIVIIINTMKYLTLVKKWFMLNIQIQKDKIKIYFNLKIQYLQYLKLIKTPRRFKVVTNPNGTTTAQFGSGDGGKNDELLIPTFKNVGLGLTNSIDKLSFPFDPSNFYLQNLMVNHQKIQQ